jgi:2-hydroxychromene-2-carboxylate isomerase
LPSWRPCEKVYTPIFLGGLMNATKNTPPIQIINKGKWINIERMRWVRLFNIPMKDTTPDGFPPLTLTVRHALLPHHPPSRAISLARPPAPISLEKRSDF